MKVYLVSLGLGLLVGVIYALFNVRSPAPPVIALVGLLGILAGEQIPPLIKRLMADEATRTSWLQQQVKPHMFGQLPSCPKPSADPAQSTPDACGDKRNG
ncbi:XapX domain-containing protein [Achromobacter pestifer]